MALEITSTESYRLTPRIVVVGVGGAGCNAVNNMINQNLDGVEFITANTDAQSLSASLAQKKIQLGAELTRGLGAGSNPEVGKGAAEEVEKELREYLHDCNMLFITAGMGGGTGTGAAPVIARVAKDMGILTVGVVTKPFDFEGSKRRKLAEEGIKALQEHVGTLIVIPNQNLFRIVNERTTFAEAFAMADQVLCSGVRGITDLIVVPGLINLDFADIRTVMSEMGKAMMGTGEADGPNRAIDVAEKAISNPLLDDVTMKGARQVLINVTGGMDLTLFEIDAAVNRIREEVLEDAHIHFGAAFDQSLQGKMRLSVVATGIDSVEMTGQMPEVKPAQAVVSRYAVPLKAPEQATPVKNPPMEQPKMEEPPVIAMPESTAPVVETKAENQEPVQEVSQFLTPDATHDNQVEQEKSEVVAEHTPNPNIAVHSESQKIEPMMTGFIPPVPTPLNAVKNQPIETQDNAEIDPYKMAEFDNAGANKKPRTSSLGGLFSRFSQGNSSEARAVQPMNHVSPLEKLQQENLIGKAPELKIHEGEKPAEENLEIPAFLRRQAN